MTVEEIKSYFDDHFFIERLTSQMENKKLINDFTAPKKGQVWASIFTIKHGLMI